MEYVKCAKCARKYSLQERNNAHPVANQSAATPILLVCGHTFCQKCMIHCASSFSAITCPACKKQSICDCDNTKIRGLFPNFCILGLLTLHHESLKLKNLNNALQAVQKKNNYGSNYEIQKCSECVKISASLSCLQCGVGFCSKCFEVTHSSSRVLQRHQAIPFHGREQDLSSLDCPKHHSLIQHYCIEDETPVCRDCISTDHSDHEVMLLREKCEEMKDQIKTGIQKAGPVLSLLKVHIDKIDEEIIEIRLYAEEKLNALLQQYFYIVGAIQTTFLSSLSEVDNLSTSQAHNLIRFRDAAVNHLHKLESTLSDANRVISIKPDHHEHAVVNPFKIVSDLQKACQIPCMLGKMTTSSPEVDEEAATCLSDQKGSTVDDTRFILEIHEDAAEFAKQWVSVVDAGNFKYSVTSASPEELSSAAQNHSVEEKPASALDDSDSPAGDMPVDDVGTKHRLRMIQVPPAKNQELVFVKWMNNPGDFYIQRTSDSKQLNLIDRTLSVFNHRPPQEGELFSCIRYGDQCVARYKKAWYRARVIEVHKKQQSLQEGDHIMDDATASSKDDIEILYIDYGNTAITKVSCIRCLPQSLRRIPPLAIPCSLVGVSPLNGERWSREALVTFFKMIKDRPVLMTTVAREAGRRYVDLHKPAPDEIDRDVPISVRDALVFLNYAKFSKKQFPLSDVQLPITVKKPSRDYLLPTGLSHRSFVNVTLSDFRSLDQFCVQQLDSHAEYLEALTAKIQDFVRDNTSRYPDPSKPFTVLFPHKGMPCLAKYKYCEAWYRATVLEVIAEEQKVKVNYVDYGNEGVVHVSDTLKIPDEFMSLPKQALTCKLADIRPTEDLESWPAEAVERFMELAGDDKALLMYIRSVHDRVHGIELFDSSDAPSCSTDLLSINERLVYEGLAYGLTVRNVSEQQASKLTKVVNETTNTSGPVDDPPSPYLLNTPDLSPRNPESVITAPPVEDKADEDVMIKVTDAQSPSVIYVQTKEQWEACNSLIREMHKHFTNCQTDKEKDVVEWNGGDSCAVFSRYEKRWCRGKIESIAENQEYQVKLIDFGRRESAPGVCLEKLPDAYQAPAFATCCSLVSIYPAGGGKKWTMTACEALQELISGQECKMEVDGDANVDGVLPVKLFVAGSEADVSRELIKKGVALPLKLGMFRNEGSDDPPPNLGSYFELAGNDQPDDDVSDNRWSSAWRFAGFGHGKRLAGATECASSSEQKIEAETALTVVDNGANEVTQEHDPDGTTKADSKPKVLPRDKGPLPMEGDSIKAVEHGFGIKNDSNGTQQRSSESFGSDTAENSNSLVNTFAVKNIDPSYSQIPPSALLKQAVKFPCIVTHIERYNLLFIRKLPVSDIGPRQEDINYLLPLESFDIGTPCVAQFTEDDKWYRAEIKNFCPDIGMALVFYVDYGLTELVLAHERLRVLTDEFCHHPAQAVACKLALAPSPDHLHLDEHVIMNTMAALIGPRELVCYVEPSTTSSSLAGPPLMHLFCTVTTPDGKKELKLIVEQLMDVLQASSHTNPCGAV